MKTGKPRSHGGIWVQRYNSLMRCRADFTRPLRKLEKCQIPQDVLSCAKWLDRRNTICISRESRKAQGKKDKEDGASEVSEEVYYIAYRECSLAALLEIGGILTVIVMIGVTVEFLHDHPPLHPVYAALAVPAQVKKEEPVRRIICIVGLVLLTALAVGLVLFCIWVKRETE